MQGNYVLFSTEYGALRMINFFVTVRISPYIKLTRSSLTPTGIYVLRSHGFVGVYTPYLLPVWSVWAQLSSLVAVDSPTFYVNWASGHLIS